MAAAEPPSPSVNRGFASTDAKPRNGLVIAAVVLTPVAVVVTAVALLLSFSGRGDSALSTTTTSSAVPNTGPFTGAYTAEFGPTTLFDGKPVNGAKPSTETWRIRSVCASDNCVATGVNTTVNRSQPAVFDQVGNSWVMVNVVANPCNNRPGQDFYVTTLQPQPDGRLTGDVRIESTAGCYSKRTATFTRTGDVDVTSMPDPADQAPRVVSPAQAFHGHYHETVVRSRNSVTFHTEQYDDIAETHCVRTGDRCISYVYNSLTLGSVPLFFENGAWTADRQYDGTCSLGGTSHVRITGTYPMPQPLQDPITQLTGHGFQEESGSSCTNSDLDTTFVRTGD
jgi:hypothetical protein